MKTDTIFYQLFLTFPASFFELIGLSSAEANNYQFTSREVKQLVVECLNETGVKN